MSSRRQTKRVQDQLDFDHPFLRWFAAHVRMNAGTFYKGEFFVTPLASRQFALGIDDTGRTVLGIMEHTVEAFEAPVVWESASLVRNVRGSDWVVLKAGAFTEADEASPGRLWLPVSSGLLNGWANLEDGERMGLSPMRRINGTLTLVDSEPFCEIPLTLNGNWSDILETSENAADTEKGS